MKQTWKMWENQSHETTENWQYIRNIIKHDKNCTWSMEYIYTTAVTNPVTQAKYNHMVFLCIVYVMFFP